MTAPFLAEKYLVKAVRVKVVTVGSNMVFTDRCCC